jgi:hypothetical protein
VPNFARAGKSLFFTGFFPALALGSRQKSPDTVKRD